MKRQVRDKFRKKNNVLSPDVFFAEFQTEINYFRLQFFILFLRKREHFDIILILFSSVLIS